MAPEFYSQWRDEAVEPQAPPVPLQVATLASPPPAPVLPARSGGCMRAHVNDALNSRLARPLPAERWRTTFGIDFDPSLRPTTLLVHEDRVVLCGGIEWSLADLSTRRIVQSGTSLGDMTLDIGRRCFYVPSEHGVLSARRLTDGTEAVAIPLSLGDIYKRMYTAIRGSRIFTTAHEQQLDVHGGSPPQTSILELTELGHPMRVSPSGLLTSAHCTGDLLLTTPSLLVATSPEHVIAARSNRLYDLDFNLDIHQVFTGTFEPWHLSLGEAGIHLVVETDEGFFLWRVSLDGIIDVSIPLPVSARSMVAPPLIAHDHSIVLLLGDRMAFVRPDGTPAWEFAPPTRIVGGTLTGNDHILLSTASAVLAFRPDGTSFPIAPFDTPVRTPAALLDDGRMIVATSDKLWVLES